MAIVIGLHCREYTKATLLFSCDDGLAMYTESSGSSSPRFPLDLFEVKKMKEGEGNEEGIRGE